MKLSDYVVKYFEELGITDLFMLSGGGCMHLVNSFGNSSKIRYWCTQHEQSAAMAAEGYAKFKNNYGLVLTTSGPGATNTITGVLDCYQDSIPVIFISGQSKTKQTVLNSKIDGLRQFGVQEANIIPIVESITKYAVEINEPNSIKYHLDKAVYLAKAGRPGPVWISIPLDVQNANINEMELEGYYDSNEQPSINNEIFKRIAEMLYEAKRPVIIGGHGIRLSGATEILEKFVSKHKIPVVTPIMGIDILPTDHNCYIGRVGIKGTRAGNFAMQNADVILSIGSRLSVSVVGHEYELFAREAKIIVVDIDPVEHKKKTINIDCFVESDAKIFLEELYEVMEQSCSIELWNEKCLEWKNCYPVVLNDYMNDSEGLNYYKFIDLLNDVSSENTPVISDAGSAFYVVSQAINIKNGQRYITTGGTATMGFTLPASIGVAIADPNRTILAVTGEGSFMQNMQELEVLRYNSLNIKLFVMNNGGYFSIRQTQSKFFNKNFVGESEQSGLSFGNMEKFADAFDIKYYRLASIEECEKYLTDIIKEEGPALIEVMVQQSMEIIPTNAAKIKEDGMMISKPLEDMYPFLPREEFEKNMYVKIIEE